METIKKFLSEMFGSMFQIKIQYESESFINNWTLFYRGTTSGAVKFAREKAKQKGCGVITDIRRI